MIKRKNLDEEIYQILLNDLLDGKFVSCSKIFADEISKDLGVSKTPVIFALKRMAQNGFLESERSSGFKNVKFDMQNAVKLKDALVFYDTSVIKHIITKISSEDTDRLMKIAKETTLSSEVAGKSYLQRDLAFHIELINCYKNEYVSDSYKRLFILLNLLRKQAKDENNELNIDVTTRPVQHIEICEAIIEKDLERIEEIYRTHYTND